ncbi:MAG: TrmH family RNA methyltransferase [Mycoplasma sp.]
MIYNITSKHNELIKDIAKNISKNKWIALDSIKFLNDTNQDKFKIKYVLCTENWMEKNEDVIDSVLNTVVLTNHDIIKKVSNTQSPPEILIVAELKISNFEITNDKNYLILDSINDPGNMGTLIRTAVSFDINDIYISKNSVNVLNEKVVRSSVGALTRVNINYYDNLVELVENLESNKVSVYASALECDATDLESVEFNYPSAIIVGNEANGIKQSDLSKIKNKIYIRIENIQSLNVAIAGAIMMYKMSTVKRCKN